MNILANLSLQGRRGGVHFYSPNEQTLSLEFSNGKALRDAMRASGVKVFRMAKLRGHLQGFSKVMNQVVEVKIQDKILLKVLPARPLNIRYLRVLPQVILYVLGK